MPAPAAAPPAAPLAPPSVAVPFTHFSALTASYLCPTHLNPTMTQPDLP